MSDRAPDTSPEPPDEAALEESTALVAWHLNNALAAVYANVGPSPVLVDIRAVMKLLGVTEESGKWEQGAPVSEPLNQEAESDSYTDHAEIRATVNEQTLIALEEVSASLLWALRGLGKEYGPLGVALVAARLSDPEAVVKILRGEVTTSDQPTEEETP